MTRWQRGFHGPSAALRDRKAETVGKDHCIQVGIGSGGREPALRLGVIVRIQIPECEALARRMD
jgi:hypothetical protein